MSTNYSGNPALYPATFQIPSDGDPRNASSVNAALEALGDRTAYLNSLSGQFVNGVTGGTYAPAAPIVIGGAGLVVNGPGNTWTPAGGPIIFAGQGLKITGAGNGWTPSSAIVLGAAGLIYNAVGTTWNPSVNPITVNGMGLAGTWGGAIFVVDVTWGPDSRPKVSSRSVTRVMDGNPWISSGTWNGQLYTAQAVDGELVFPLHVPHGATLTGVLVRIKPDSTHSTIPVLSDRPLLQVLRRASDGSTHNVGPVGVNDPVTDLTVYETEHGFSITGLTEVFDRIQNRYFLLFRNERGANAKANLQVLWVSATFTMTQLDEGAA